jgi:phage terminase large subunit-like protein
MSSSKKSPRPKAPRAKASGTTDVIGLRVPRFRGKSRRSRAAETRLGVADAYARECLTGTVGVRVQAMARRYLAEREPGSGVVWDEDRLAEALAWGESKLPTKAGPTAWSPWMVWVVAMFVARRTAEGLPKTRELMLQVPRGCGKTQLAAALCGWTLDRAGREGRVGCEVIVLATMLEKAKEVADRLGATSYVASKTWRASGATGNRSALVRSESGYVKCCASTPQNADGITPTLIILDEAARMDVTYNRALSSMVKVPFSQALIVTTPDVDQYLNPYGTALQEAERALDEGTDLPDGVLAVMYQADLNDDPTEESTWRKANPELGHRTPVSEYQRKKHQAVSPDPKVREEFFTQLLATFTPDLAAAIPVAFYDACVDPWQLEDAQGLPAVVSVDFSVGGWAGVQYDLTSMNLAVWDGVRLLSRNWHYWAGQDPAADEVRTRQPIRQWMQEGRLVNCGRVIDYGILERQIEVIARVVDLKWLVADPVGKAGAWCDSMEKKHGWQWSRAPQNGIYMGSAWAIWQDYVRGRKVRFDTDPVLRSAIECTRLYQGARTPPYPVKSHDRANNDPLIAALMGIKVMNDREMLTESMYADASRISF